VTIASVLTTARNAEEIIIAEDRTTLAALLNPATVALDMDLNTEEIAGIVDIKAVRMIDPIPRIE
jgi:hypothetical protein